MRAHPDLIDVKVPRWFKLQSWLFEKWCFVRVLAQKLGTRAALLFGVWGAVTLMLFALSDHQHPSLVEAGYTSLALLLGELPSGLPRSKLAQLMFFTAPLVGLAVVVETIVELGRILRDREQNRLGWSRVMAMSMTKHVIVVGMGKVGYRTYSTLKRLGARLVVIDRSEDGEFMAELRASGVPVLIGDARRDALLEDAHVAAARAIVVATDNDMVNLEVALDARRKNPNIRVVMRMFDQNLADKVQQGFDIPAALSTATIGAPTLAATALLSNVLSTTIIDNQLLLTVRYTVRRGDPWCGRRITEVVEMHRVGILSTQRDQKGLRLFPPLSTEILENDVLVVQGPYQELVDLGVAST